MKCIRIALSTLVALGLAACATAPAPKPVVVEDAAQKPVEKTADEYFADGVRAFDAQKLDEAEALFTQALEKAPDNVSVTYNLGVVAERKGDFQKARAHYEAAHKLDPSHTPTLLNLGKVYRHQAKYDLAIALYEKALEAPGREFDVQLLNNLAVSYRLAKQYGKAEGALRKLLSRTTDNPEAYKNLSLVYYDQGNYRLAEFLSATARKLDDKDPGVYNNLGMIYLKQDDKARALAQFQKAVELNPKFAPGHLNIGAMALSYRDYENAEEALRKAIELDPLSPEARYFLAWALEGQKGRDPKKGLEGGGEFERYLQWRPDDSSAICGAGWAYSVERTGFQKAIDYLGKCKVVAASTLTPTDVQLIDAKVKGLENMLKAPQAAPAPQAEPKREAPKPGAGTNLLDKVSAEEAAQEAAQPAADPAAGQPDATKPPEGGQPK